MYIGMLNNGYNFRFESKGILPNAVINYNNENDPEEINEYQNDKKIKLKEFVEKSPENKKMALVCALRDSSYGAYELIMNAGNKLSFKEGDINSAILLGISKGYHAKSVESFEKYISLSLQHGIDINSPVEGKPFISIIAENNLTHQIVTLIEHNVSIDKETYSKNIQLFSDALKEIAGKNVVKRLQSASNGFNSFVKLIEKEKPCDIELG